MSIASDYTALLLAELPEPVADTTERDPDDFGRDTWCFDTLQTGRLMSDRDLVASDLYRRIITPPGGLAFLGTEDDRAWGFGVQRYLGSLATAATIGSELEQQLRLSVYVQTVAARVTEQRLPDNSRALELLVGATTTAGPIRFKVGVDQVSARFLGLEPA